MCVRVCVRARARVCVCVWVSAVIHPSSLMRSESSRIRQ